MSNSQKHGVWLEEQIKASGRFPGAEVQIGNRNELHDVNAEFDPSPRKKVRLPSSIKTLKSTSGTICLADALRFFDVTGTSGVRLVVARFKQTGKEKVFYETVEFNLRPQHVKALWGEITRDEILTIRESIKWDKIEPTPDGDKLAREVAEAQTDKLKNRRGLVTLNRKIGSKHHERRIQCSITIKRIEKLLSDEPGAIVRYKETYGALSFPFAMESSSRVNALPSDRPRKKTAAKVAEA